MANSGLFGGMFGNSYIQNGTKAYDTNRHIVDKNKNIVYLDGITLMSFSSSTFICPDNMYIFTMNLNGNVDYGGDPIILYSFQIYNNDSLVLDFIPCKRKSDNKPGLYDTVEGKFYTNQNTSGDDFVTGDNV